MKPIKGIISSLFLALAATAMGQQVDRLGLTDISVATNDNISLTVTMNIKPNLCHLGTDKMLKVVPVIRSADGESEKELPAYAIAGRNQYYYNLRSNAVAPLYRCGAHLTDTYTFEVPWQDWMGESTLGFKILTSGCCGAPISEEDIPVADLDLVPPVIPSDADLQYIEPVATAVKEYALQGKAYVNFPVNRTEIYPAYMNNPVELKKITNSIDTVRDNKDATIESITLTGYASPEGPYNNNVRLAKGRTEAVRDYVSKLYDFPASVYKTASVPEDWAGLREAVVNSALENREDIIRFIDSDYPIEKRNDRLRQLFPRDYAWLLQNVYPWLRHTDYLIKYNVKKYSDVNEIRQVLATRPQNLTLDEIYLLANTYQPGTPEYNEIFEVAVRLFPEDLIANLNAANNAIARNDLDNARKYLEKAGDSSNADYARGMLAAKEKDYQQALVWLRKCGTPKAQSAIERINQILNFKGGVTFR